MYRKVYILKYVYLLLGNKKMEKVINVVKSVVRGVSIRVSKFEFLTNKSPQRRVD